MITEHLEGPEATRVIEAVMVRGPLLWRALVALCRYLLEV